MAVFSYETSSSPSIKLSSNFEERNVDSYNESSAIYIIDDIYGSIFDNANLDYDYGSIVDINLTGQQVTDYGFITTNETIVPYGSIDVGNNDFAAVKLSKIKIGDVSFVFLGEANVFTIPIEKGSGFIRFSGTSGDPVITLNYIGSGALFGFSSTTESISVNPLDQTLLFRFSGNGLESSTSPHVGSGSLFTFISKTESIVVSPDDTQVLFSIFGNSVEKRTGSHIGSGSIFSIAGSNEATVVIPRIQGVLFDIFGTIKERFIPTVHIGTGLVNMEGLSEDKKVNFVQAKPTRIILI